jgi:UDP-N-acetylmuramate: L-alanyl-gamma-D-glutamyl-meso-diaminopimelate ligase
MATFTGAAKRLEVLAQGNGAIVYRDFAHAPSKVRATMEAVKAQYPDKKLYAVLELHTYSSLNEAFMREFNGVMQPADEGVVFYSRHALELKRMPLLEKEAVQRGFGQQALQVFNQKNELENWLAGRDYGNSIVLLMSSGNYEGLDIEGFSKKATGTTR